MSNDVKEMERQQRMEIAMREIKSCMDAWGRHLKPGVVLTHARCMGCVEEHVYTGKDGIWLCGYPTVDTYKMSKMDGKRKRDCLTNDISPTSVTHVNRIPIDALDAVMPHYLEPIEKVSGGAA